MAVEHALGQVGGVALEHRLGAEAEGQHQADGEVGDQHGGHVHPTSGRASGPRSTRPTIAATSSTRRYLLAAR